ncbi:hypothetical protein C8Q78DRAFT_1083797 [Trametes maxima]|nr:hypothetical protein C8Q78DRAFT_1083797 [Trametes maxima]
MDFERQFRLLGEDSADSDTPSTSEAEELSYAIPTSESGSGNSDYAERPSILSFPLYDDLPERHIQSRSICVPPFEPIPLVPVLFITEEESEIVPLMTSILDQKRVLRHGLPAIGILYDTRNEVCRVFFGWNSPVEDGSGQMNPFSLAIDLDELVVSTKT